MMARKLPLLALCLPMATACVDQRQWSPTVDTYGSSRAQFVSRDTEECRQLAMRTSGGTTRQAAGGAVGGGLLGAATGGIGGGAMRGYQSNAAFQRAFNQCMRNRGHNVLS